MKEHLFFESPSDSYGSGVDLWRNRPYGEIVRDHTISDVQRLDLIRGRIEAHLQEGRGAISHSSITIEPDELGVLLSKITPPPNISMEDKLRKARKRAPLADPVAFYLGGVLQTHFGVAKPADASSQILSHLFDPRLYGETEQPVEKQKLRGLTTEVLNHTMELLINFEDEDDLERPETQSVTRQLRSPFQIAHDGLVILPNKGSGQQDFYLPKAFLGILSDLRFEESAEVLETWIYETLSGDKAQFCLDFLQSLAEFTVFLDNKSYFHLLADSRGEIPLRPFRSLHEGVTKAIKWLNKIEGAEEAVTNLQKVSSTILTRFHQVLVGPLKGQLTTADPETFTPKSDDMAIDFLTWAEDKITLSGTSLNVVAEHAVSYLRVSGITDVFGFTDTLLRLEEDIPNEWVEELAMLINKEAIRVNYIQNNHAEIVQDIMIETLEQLKDNPWRDLADYDFAELIDENCDTVQIFLYPGTFGPWTDAGHGSVITKLQAYMDRLDKMDPHDKKVKRMLVIAPILDASGPGYSKDSATIGDISERVSTIILQNSNLDHDRVFLTTKMRPDPAKAGTSLGSIRHFETSVHAKLDTDLKRAGRVPKQNIKIIPCYGLDEIEWDDSKETIAKQQPTKITGVKNCVFIGRHGFLVKAILNAEKIEDILTEGGNVDFILTPGIPGASTSQTLDSLRRRGYTSNVTIPAITYIQEHWSRRSIEQRRAKLSRENGKSQKVLSVTSINEVTIREYEKIVEATVGVSVK